MRSQANAQWCAVSAICLIVLALFSTPVAAVLLSIEAVALMAAMVAYLPEDTGLVRLGSGVTR